NHREETTRQGRSVHHESLLDTTRIHPGRRGGPVARPRWIQRYQGDGRVANLVSPRASQNTKNTSAPGLDQLRNPTPRLSSHSASAASTATKPSINAKATHSGTSLVPSRP